MFLQSSSSTETMLFFWLVAVQTRLYSMQYHVSKNFIEQLHGSNRAKVRDQCCLPMFLQHCEQSPSPARRDMASLQMCLWWGRCKSRPSATGLVGNLQGRGASLGKEVAEGWKISFQVMVGIKIFKQQAGSKGCGGVSRECRPTGDQSRNGGCLDAHSL